MDTLRIVNKKLMEETFESQGLWVKNQGRLTTTDALNTDWFYCKADNDYPEQKYQNQNFIHKATTKCAGVDRIGEIREVFNDRICDGYVDCFDQSDENGELGTCLIEPKRHPVKHANCPFEIIGTHKHVETCVGGKQDDMGNWVAHASHDGYPAWHCNEGYDGLDYWIYHTTLVPPGPWPFNNRDSRGIVFEEPKSGWVYSRKGKDLENEKLATDALRAFHPDHPRPSESCIVFTTTENNGKVDINLQFKTQADQWYQSVHIKSEPWTYCFPSEDLESYTLTGEKDKWVGEISITHTSKTDAKYATSTRCTENCDCQCTGTEEEDCTNECLSQEVINLGLDDDSNAEGETKCLHAKSCSFEVSWIVDGTFGSSA